MTKGWWIDTKKRVKGPVEAWTEKFVSPHLFAEGTTNPIDLASPHWGRTPRRPGMDINPRPQRRPRSGGQDLPEIGRNHRQHPSGRGIPSSGHIHLSPVSIPAPARSSRQPQPCPRRREKVEELAPDDTGSDHVRQRQPGRRTASVQTERAGGIEGPERMCDLLLGDLNGHADAE